MGGNRTRLASNHSFTAHAMPKLTWPDHALPRRSPPEQAMSRIYVKRLHVRHRIAHVVDANRQDQSASLQQASSHQCELH